MQSVWSVHATCTKQAAPQEMRMTLPKLGLRLHGGLDPQRCVAFAVAGEAGGFASAWFAENPMERGVMAAVAACAVATRRIELGIGVWNPYMRHPAQIAMEIGALDELAQGRAALGIGSGLAAPIRRLGIDNSRPLAALRDTFHIVRTMLRGERVTYSGPVFSVDAAKLSFTPRRPHMPLLMAARGEKALGLAGRIADGLMVSNMCPPGFARYATAVMQAGAEKAGRPMPARVIHYVPCVVAADRRKASDTIKPVLAGMLRTFWALAQNVPAARTSLVGHSGIPEADFAATIERLQAGSSPGAAIDDRFVEAFSVAGTPEECLLRSPPIGMPAYRTSCSPLSGLIRWRPSPLSVVRCADRPHRPE
jgi:5,10-methylenetetrahydromethanopterin reductase